MAAPVTANPDPFLDLRARDESLVELSACRGWWGSGSHRRGSSAPTTRDQTGHFRGQPALGQDVMATGGQTCWPPLGGFQWPLINTPAGPGPRRFPDLRRCFCTRAHAAGGTARIGCSTKPTSPRCRPWSRGQQTGPRRGSGVADRPRPVRIEVHGRHDVPFVVSSFTGSTHTTPGGCPEGPLAPSCREGWTGRPGQRSPASCSPSATAQPPFPGPVGAVFSVPTDGCGARYRTESVSGFRFPVSAPVSGCRGIVDSVRDVRPNPSTVSPPAGSAQHLGSGAGRAEVRSPHWSIGGSRATDRVDSAMG